MKPSEALGVFTDHVDRRFNDMDENFRNKLIDAMKSEDAKLQTYIEKHQLDSWHRTVVDEAEKSVVREYDMQIRALAGDSTDDQEDEPMEEAERLF
jgi:nuclear pore complex protein Nup133